MSIIFMTYYCNKVPLAANGGRQQRDRTLERTHTDLQQPLRHSILYIPTTPTCHVVDARGRSVTVAGGMEGSLCLGLPGRSGAGVGDAEGVTRAGSSWYASWGTPCCPAPVPSPPPPLHPGCSSGTSPSGPPEPGPCAGCGWGRLG